MSLIPISAVTPGLIPIAERGAKRSRLKIEQDQAGSGGVDVALGALKWLEPLIRGGSLQGIGESVATAMTPVLESAQTASRLGRGAAVDVMGLPYKEPGDELFPNVPEATMSTGYLPGETEVGPVQRGIANAAEGLPKAVAATIASIITKNPVASFGGLFGVDAAYQNRDQPLPVQLTEGAKGAAIGGLIPIVGGAAGHAAGRALAPLAERGVPVVRNVTAQKIAESIAGQAGAQAVMSGARIPEYAQMSGPELKDALIEEGVSNLGLLPMEAPRFRKGVPSETQRAVAADAPRYAHQPLDDALQATDPRYAQKVAKPTALTEPVDFWKMPKLPQKTPAVESRAEVERPSLSLDAPYLLREGWPNQGVKIDPTQMRNWVKNKVTPGEFVALEEAGLEGYLKEKRTPGEVAKWVEENGPRVETKVLSADATVSGATARQANLQHELETAGYKVRKSIDTRFFEVVKAEDFGNHERGPLGDVELGREYKFSDYGDTPLPKEVVDKVVEMAKLEEQSRLASRTQNESATARYTMVNPKPLDKMPGAVDLLVRIPTKRRPSSKEMQENDWAQEGEVDFPAKYSSSHYPTEGKNLLAHVRGYMETTTDGKKVFHVFEVQSDWAQEVQDIKVFEKDNPNTYRESKHWQDKQRIRDPLLKHYERLALKAAIDHARKNGADAIAVSDAETAMVTEGQDRVALHEVEGQSSKFPVGEEGITQAKGMRLHYDQTLPKIAEELTGNKGEMVEFGEHQNTMVDKASSDPAEWQRIGGQERDNVTRLPRPDLIFKNPDGTPKTTITARLYLLSGARKSFSLFGSDKPAKPQAQKGMQVQPGKRSGEAGFLGLPSRAPSTPPRTPINTIDLLPDFDSRSVELAKATEEFGPDKVPILKHIIGGRSRIKTDTDRSIARFNLEKEGIGTARASAFSEKMRDTVDTYFTQAKIGDRVPGARRRVYEKGDLNITPTDPTLSLKPSDVFEELQRNPTAYRLNANQKRVWDNLLKPILDRATALKKKYKVTKLLDEYFPRGTPNAKLSIPKLQSSRAITRGSGERVYITEAEGWSKGEEYEMSLEKRLAQGVAQMYDAIASKRLATDPMLKGRSRKKLEADFAASYPTASVDQVKRRVDAFWKQGQVDLPGFKGKAYSKETAERLRKELIRSNDPALQAIATGNAFIKGVRLAYDAGAPLVHGQAIAFSYPKVWSTSVLKSLQAFSNDKVMSEFVRQNWQPISELGEFGSSVGRLVEFMRGAGMISTGARKVGDLAGQLLEKGVTKTIGAGKISQAARATGKAASEIVATPTDAFNRMFQTFLDVAKVELWKAAKQGRPKSEWNNIIRSVEAMTLTGRMESGNVSRQRAFYERVAFNAPAYYRGAITLIGMLGHKGVPRKMAVRGLSSLALGSMALYYGIAKYKHNMEDEEIQERLDPNSAQFMMWTEENGPRPLEVGMGGIMRSILKLMWGLGNRVATGDVAGLSKFTSEDNPLARFYRAHAGPVPGAAWTAVTGKDYLGTEQDIWGVIADMKPLVLDATTVKEGRRKFLGLNAFPAKNPSAADVARKLFGKDTQVESLKLGDRRKLAAEVDKQRYPETEADKQRAAERALKYNFENKKELKAALSKENQDWLTINKLEVPGYTPAQTVAGQKISFTEKERGFFAKALAEEYDAAINRLRGQQGVSEKAKAVRLERLLGAAKDKAHARLIRARRTNSF